MGKIHLQEISAATIRSRMIDYTPPLQQAIKGPFLPGLKLDASFNYDLHPNFEKLWSTPYYYYEYNPNTKEYDKKQGTGKAAASLTDTYRKWTTMLYNFRVSYDKTFNNSHIAAMVGAEQQQSTYSFASATRRNFLSSSIPQIDVEVPPLLI